MRGDMDRTDQWLYRGVTLLVVALGVAAASRSWISLSALAHDKGWQGQAPILPLCLEGFALAGTLMAWVRMRQGRGAKLAWLVAFVIPLLLSMAANMAHAWEQYPGDEVALAISSLPPAVWAACTALAVHYLRQARHIPTPVPVPVEALDDRAGPQVPEPSQARRPRPEVPSGHGVPGRPATTVAVRGSDALVGRVPTGDPAADAGVGPAMLGRRPGDRGRPAVAGTSAPGTPRPGDPETEVMTPREAVRHTLTARGVNASDVSPGDIINPVRVLTQADTSKRYVANILTELRKEPALIERNGKPQRDDEVRVR